LEGLKASPQTGSEKRKEKEEKKRSDFTGRRQLQQAGAIDM
jgi:hypothetical protein